MSALGRVSDLDSWKMSSSLMQLLILLNNLFKMRQSELLTARSKVFPTLGSIFILSGGAEEGKPKQ